MEIKRVNDIQGPAQFIANSILKHLNAGEKVLWLATGGSSIAVGVEVAKIIKEHPHQNLIVTLTDERYGEINHPDSNWNQLLDKGFDLPEAKLIPVLLGENRDDTTQKFNTALEGELKSADYKIGLFGIGTDFHTAGILPGSGAVFSEDLAFGYNSEKFERITITPKTIQKLDEVIVFMQGEEKEKVLKILEQNASINDQPAQILKKVPLLTIFYKK